MFDWVSQNQEQIILTLVLGLITTAAWSISVKLLGFGTNSLRKHSESTRDARVRMAEECKSSTAVKKYALLSLLNARLVFFATLSLFGTMGCLFAGLMLSLKTGSGIFFSVMLYSLVTTLFVTALNFRDLVSHFMTIRYVATVLLEDTSIESRIK